MTLLGTFTKTDHTIKSKECQQVNNNGEPPTCIHNITNYAQFMRETGHSEEYIRNNLKYEYETAIHMFKVNYPFKHKGKIWKGSFPYDPWQAVQPEQPVKKKKVNLQANKGAKQEKVKREKFRPEIRIHADALREVLGMGLTPLENQIFFIIAIEILQWQHHRDNNHTAKISQTKIAKQLTGKTKLDQVKKIIESLEKKGLIKVNKKPNCKTCKGQSIQLLKY